MNAITNFPPQGRAFIHGSGDERARFISFTRFYIDAWLDAPGENRTFADLTVKLDVGPDQVSRWMRGLAVPSRDSVQKLCAKGVFPNARVEVLEEQKEWMKFPPFVPARNQEKKQKKQKKLGAGELAAGVVTSDNASNVYDALAGDPSISTKNKMALSALIALASSGATIDIEITARAR